MSPKRLISTQLLLWAVILAVTPGARAQLIQQGSKLSVGGNQLQGYSVALSADGNTALIGGFGGAFVWTRSAGVWTQQGPKLIGSGASGNFGAQGSAVALSADGNTALVSSSSDNNGAGATWVWIRSGGIWTQQGDKLVGTGGSGNAAQGSSVALSGDGNTAAVGGPGDSSSFGATWVFARSNGVWTQQGNKLVGSGGSGNAAQGSSVALSADGNTLLTGGKGDGGGVGASWVFTRSGSTWSQQGEKLVAQDASGNASQGCAVALSGDGNTALIGGSSDSAELGAAWIWMRTGSNWLKGPKLVGSGAVTGQSGTSQGFSVSLSADGNTALIGGPNDASFFGAAWIFVRSGGSWPQQGSKILVSGNAGVPQAGFSVDLSGDGGTALIGGIGDASLTGAAWVFVQSTATRLVVSAPSTATSGSSFNFTVTAQDLSGATVQGYSGTLHFTSSDGTAVLPANATLNGGTGTFQATLKTGGSQTITATDTLTASITGTSGAIQVSGTTAKFAVVAPSTASANQAVNFTVTAQDINGATIPGYAGTIHFTSTDGSASLPANATLANGSAQFTIVFHTGGNHTITATDTATPSVKGTSASIAVTGPGPHFAVIVPSNVAPGNPFNVTVIAQDTANNTMTGYSGKVHFTSGDPVAVLPLDSTLVNGVGSFLAVMKTPGNWSITVTDSVNGLTGISSEIAVAPWTTAHFLVSAPAAATAGVPFTVTVTAQAANNSTITNYAGLVSLGSTDGLAELPANITLNQGTASFQATIKTAGSQAILASGPDPLNGPPIFIGGNSGPIIVSAGPAAKLSLAVPSLGSVGASFNFSVTAQDAFGNTAPSYAGTVHFTSTDANAVLPANATLIGGTRVFTATPMTVGKQTITATDTANAGITGTSIQITVGAQVTHFLVAGPATATAGTAFNFTVTALNDANVKVAGYTGTVKFSSTDPLAVVPAGSSLVNGVATFPATLKTTGSQTITATDAANASVTGTTNPIAVGVGSVVRLAITLPATTTAGTSFNITVKALDAVDNPVTSYSGTLQFTSTDPSALLPASGTITNGTGTFPVTLRTAGEQTIHAMDIVNGAYSGTSPTIVVSGGQATHFSVTAPSAATVNVPVSITVKALDAFGNTSAGYAGTIRFLSSDGLAVLPANTPLPGGTGTFSVTLKTQGIHNVTVADVASAALAGSSNTITVSIGTATHFAINVPATVTTGTAFNFMVTAQDAGNNTVPGYNGTVHFTSSDGAAVLPANMALVNGTGTFSATLKTIGTQSLSATDVAAPAINGTSGGILVASLATHFAVTVPASASAGTAFTFTVTALDAGNAPVTAYAGTVRFLSGDTTAILPANSTLVNGTGTFTATLRTAGNQSITAVDTVLPSVFGTSAVIPVSGGAATHLTVQTPASVTAGQVFTVTVNALDAFNNLANGYGGSVRFTSSDQAAALPPDTVLANGTGTFSATLKTSGTQVITVTDKATAAINGGSGNIAVSASGATHLSVGALSNATAGTPFTFTVTALDAFNNMATGYAGSVKFTSSDAAAVLPANSTLVNGTKMFTATLNTAGSQTISASDTVTTTINGTSAGITVSGTVGGGPPPAPVSVTPGSGTGNTASLSFQFSDPRGFQDLDVVNVLINDFLDGRKACYLAYSRPTSTLYLVNDDGATLSQGLALNGSGSISNGQCTVASAGSSATGNGNTLTLALNLTFNASFAGYRVAYLAARDVSGGNSGWQALGNWRVTGGATSGPQPAGVTPARSSGSGAQAFTFTFTDTNGWEDLGVVNVLVNDFLNGNQACYLAYSRAGNVLYLVNDSGNGLSAPLVLNGAGSVSNGQCTVTGAGSSAVGGGNTLTLTLNVSFAPGFAGNRIIYMAARSNGDVLNSGWQAAGTRTIQ